MLGIQKINPMARAIGTMGVVTALVGGVTFAALQSDAAALTDNTLTSSTAALQIASNAQTTFGANVSGINTKLTPGVPSSFTFYLKNTGDGPLNITASVPDDLTASPIPPANVTLTFNCGGGAVSYSLADWDNGGNAVIPGGALANGQTWTCTETATLDAGYSGAGGAIVTPFKVNFVGNQVAVTP